MSVASAVAFLRYVRAHDALARRVDALRADATYEALCAFGREAGFEFGTDDLAAAFRFDWTARRIHYASREAGRS